MSTVVHLMSADPKPSRPHTGHNTSLLTSRARRADRCPTWLILTWMIVLVCAPVWAPPRASADTIEPIPPFMLEGVAPNLVISFDTSLTMLRADAPELAAPGTPLGRGPRNYYSSPDVNKLYYDPTTVYLPPLRADGTQFPDASFTGAYEEPFRPCGSRDLSKEYGVVYRFDNDINPCPVWSIDGPENEHAFYHLFDRNRDGCSAFTPKNQTPDECFRHIKVGDDEDVKAARCAEPFSAPRYPGHVCTPNPNLPNSREAAKTFLKTNFANWYSYYRIRSLAAKTAISRAMAGMNSRVRLAWQEDRTGQLGPGTDAFNLLANTFDVYQSGQRSKFYQWVQGIDVDQDGEVRKGLRVGAGASRVVSDLIRAGEFYRTDFAQSDNIGAMQRPPEDYVDENFGDYNCGVKCRQNFYLVLTDGDWRDDWDNPTSTGPWPCPPDASTRTCDLATTRNQDGSDHSLPKNPFGVNDYSLGDSTQLYWDKNIGMMADAAFYYWRTDLRPDDENEVVPDIQVKNDPARDFNPADFWHPRNDPATWQHMRTFVIGFGAVGAVTPIADDDGVFIDGSYSDADDSPISSNVAQQPRLLSTHGFPGRWSSFDGLFNPRDDKFGVAKVDDIFHTALNSRGRYFSASNPVELEQAFRTVMETVSAALGKTTNTSVAFDMGTLTADTLAYQVLVDTEHWTSELIAWKLWNGQGEASDECRDYFARYPDANSDTHMRGMPCQQAWEAAERLADQTATNRVILTRVDGNTKSFRPATFSSLAATHRQVLGLYGCQATDQTCTAQAANDLADRVDYLRGDTTKEVGEGGQFRHRESLLGDIIYSNLAYVGPPNRLFDDASYHTFRTNNATRRPMLYVGANDGMLHAFDASDGNNGGREVFAYIPEAVYPALGRLTEPNYAMNKRAFVDGGISTADVKIEPNWQTVLVGSLGAGARGVYALKITDPNLNESSDPVLWEFPNANTRPEDRDLMGYSIAPPAIVERRNGPWVALVSNGFDSPDGQAALIVLEMAGGTPKALKTQSGSGENPNALAQATAVSNQGDFKADVAYAGDLLGNLWRFDLANLTADPTLLFQARDSGNNVQPITSGVAVQRHPSGVGNLILFGTGKYLNTEDKADLSKQTFYAIWDTTGSGLQACNASSPRVERNQLAERKFSRALEVTGTDNRVVSSGRTVTGGRLDWGTQCGWRLDLRTDSLAANEGERVITQPQVRLGRVLFVSVIPGDCCASGGNSWINALNANTGLPLPGSPFDYNQDGVVDFGDLLTMNGETVVGASIRPESGGGGGIFTNPSALVLPGGDALNILTDSRGEMTGILEATGLDWRNWHQIR